MKMVKRILIIVSIVFASFVVIAGGAVGISYLSGGFNETVIDITHLYFDKDDNTSVFKEIKTLDDIVSCVHFQPANATNRELEVIVVGGSNDNGTLFDVPTTIKAGEDFKLKVNKDGKGNNVGGTVTLKIKPKGDQVIAGVTLKAVVDVNIPDNSLYFSGSNTGKVTLQGKEFTLPISDQVQNIYLKSTLINAFYLQANNKNIKNVQVGYEYRDLNGNLYNTVGKNGYVDLTDSLFDNYEDGKIPSTNVGGIKNYYHKIPLLADRKGQIIVTAKMHRTSEIEDAFVSNGFDKLPDQLAKVGNFPAQAAEVWAKVGKYNDFINRYIPYFDTSLDSYNFFKGKISYSGESSTGLVSLNSPTDISESFKYVFATATAKINVTAIKLQDFTSSSVPMEYDVFSSKVYSLYDIKEDFGLTVTTDNETAPGEEEEKEYLFETLKVSPYLYLSKEHVSNDMFIQIDEDTSVIEWAGREGKDAYEYLIVDAFNGNTPHITKDGSSETIEGYLLKLKYSDEYISVSERMINSERHWVLNCNVPLPNSDSSANDEIYKALYLGFSVSGISSEDNQLTEIKTFSRVYVNYVGLTFEDKNQNNITLKELNPNMVVNRTDVDDKNVAQANKLATGRFEQAISVNWDEVKFLDDANGNAPSYTNVMYFAESTSNAIEGTAGKNLFKIATVGKYKFQNFYDTNISIGNEDSYSAYHQYANKDLIGERIPTRAVIDGYNEYAIQVLNAHSEPVKVFAVVYLSDSKGRPIDANGRLIQIDETNTQIEEKDYPALVVLNITDITAQININSYVDNINFYTSLQSEETIVFEDGSEVIFEGNFFNRNKLKYYRNEANELLDVTKINDFLKLKLLKDNLFTLYISNHELSDFNKLAPEVDGSLEFTFDVYKPSNSKSQEISSATFAYSVGTTHNKTIAFNNFCEEISDATLITGRYINAEVIDDTKYQVQYDANGDAISIKYLLNAVEMTDNSEDGTGLAQENKISVDPDNGSNIFCTALTSSSSSSDPETGVLSSYSRENWITYVTNELEVEEINLSEDIAMKTKLTAAYYQNEGLQFSVLNNNSYEQYKMLLENGHLKYNVVTNLVKDGVINNKIVDPSQALEGEIRDKLDGEEVNKQYNNLSEYIYFYTNPEYQHTQPIYTNATEVVSFAEDWQFTNLRDNELQDGICFGSKTFAVENGKVNINGYKLDVVENSKEINGNNVTYYGLNIPKGTYFPMVGSSSVLIYNELFAIETEDGVSQIYENGSNTGKSILVDLSASVVLSSGDTISYIPRNYVDDTTTGSALDITPPGENETISEASVRFIRGEELGEFFYDANGQYKLVGGEFRELEEDSVCFGDKYSPIETYVKDPEGDYKLVDGMTYQLIESGEQYTGDRYKKVIEYRYDPDGNFKLLKGSFVKITELNYQGDRYGLKTIFVEDENGRYYYNGTNGKFEVVPTTNINVKRYSKKGVTTHLLMSIDVMGGAKTFYKAIEYELVQEDIYITSYNTDGTLNSSNTPQVYEAGKAYTINLGLAQNSGEAWVTGGVADSGTFFNTVKFDIANKSVDDIKLKPIEESGNVKRLKLTIPEMATTTTFAIQMSYSFKGVNYDSQNTDTPKFYIAIKPSIIFEPSLDEGVVDGVYNIDLPLGVDNKYSADIFNTDTTAEKSLLNNYFVTSTNGLQVNDVKLHFDNDSKKYVSVITDDNGADQSISINGSYAEYNGSQIVYDEIVADIELCLANSKSIKLPYKLKFKLLPQYIIDLTGLSEATSIMDGTNLYEDYIRVFKTTYTNTSTNTTTNITIPDIKNKNSKYLVEPSEYSKIFEISAGRQAVSDSVQDKRENEQLIQSTKDLLVAETITDGKIKLINMPYEDKKLYLQLSYAEGNETNGVVHTAYFETTVKGVVVNYSEAGTAQESITNAIAINNPEDFKQEINIVVDRSNNIADYIKPTFADPNYDKYLFAVVYLMQDGSTDTGENPTPIYDLVAGYKYRLAIATGIEGTTKEPEMIVETNHIITVGVANFDVYKSEKGQFKQGQADDKTKVNYVDGGVKITLALTGEMPTSVFNYIYVEKIIPNTNPNPVFYVVLYKLDAQGEIENDANPQVQLEVNTKYKMAIVQGTYNGDLTNIKPILTDYTIEVVSANA